MLLLAQFAYNSAISEPIGTLPFFANYGYQPIAYKQPWADKIKAEVAMIHTSHIRKFQEQLALDFEFIN